MTGVIKKVDQKKRYGFIRGDDGVDYFFHSSGLEQTTVDFSELAANMAVRFTNIRGPKGPRAIEVAVIPIINI